MVTILNPFTVGGEGLSSESSKPRSLEELRQIFSRLLDKPTDNLPSKFYEQKGKLAAHQNSYIPNYDDLVKIYNYAVQVGRVEQDEENLLFNPDISAKDLIESLKILKREVILRSSEEDIGKPRQRRKAVWVLEM